MIYHWNVGLWKCRIGVKIGLGETSIGIGRIVGEDVPEASVPRSDGNPSRSFSLNSETSLMCDFPDEQASIFTACIIVFHLLRTERTK